MFSVYRPPEEIGLSKGVLLSVGPLINSLKLLTVSIYLPLCAKEEVKQQAMAVRIQQLDLSDSEAERLGQGLAVRVQTMLSEPSASKKAALYGALKLDAKKQDVAVRLLAGHPSCTP